MSLPGRLIMELVKCIKVWGCTGGYEPKLNEEFEVVREFFYNGEHWYALRAKDGTKFEAPCIFYDEI
jgi:hypothetical protein